MLCIVILDLIQNPQGGDASMTPNLSKYLRISKIVKCADDDRFKVIVMMCILVFVGVLRDYGYL